MLDGFKLLAGSPPETKPSTERLRDAPSGVCVQISATFVGTCGDKIPTIEYSMDVGENTTNIGAKAALRAFTHAQSVVDSVLGAFPAAAQFAELVKMRCGIRIDDIIDHLILPSSDFETAGWIQLGENRWRYPANSVPDIVCGDRPGFALRVDDVQYFASGLGRVAGDLAVTWDGTRLRLFEGSGAMIEVVDDASWRGLCDAPSSRIVRRAQLHRQLLRTRPRQFKTVEAGMEVATRMVHAAATDLGSSWASALFLCTEREYWASRCEAAYLRARRQGQFGLGWGNVEYHSYNCSRASLHSCVDLFGLLGFRRRDLILESDRLEPEPTSRASLVMVHPMLRATVVLKADAIEDEASDNFGQFPVSPATWHGQSGLWCAVHSESLLEGGMSHIGARYDASAVLELFAEEDVELLQPSVELPGFAVHLTRAEQRTVDPRRVYQLKRQGYIQRDTAEAFHFNGAIATHVVIIERQGPSEWPAYYPEERLPSGRVDKPRRQRHRSRLLSTRRSQLRS